MMLKTIRTSSRMILLCLDRFTNMKQIFHKTKNSNQEDLQIFLTTPPNQCHPTQKSPKTHENLQNHYMTNFNLMQHHKYSLTELDNMMPFEREIYVQLLINHIREENERLRDQQNQR